MNPALGSNKKSSILVVAFVSKNCLMKYFIEANPPKDPPTNKTLLPAIVIMAMVLAVTC